MLHYPKHPETPVLLYLHGGPGFAESTFAYLLNQEWGDLFTQVHWDQRGAGKTLGRNKGGSNPKSISQMLDDLHEVIAYLKRVYQTEKIVLLGHSWGSVLGSFYVLQHPETVSAYIGCGQVVNMMENERMGYRLAIEIAIKNGYKKQIQQLKQIAGYPPEEFDVLMKQLTLVRKVQESDAKDAGAGSLVKMMKKSPVFRWHDLVNLMRSSKANRCLLRELFSVDLNALDKHYKVPVYYILGEEDTTVPTALSIAYYETIHADYKGMTIIPGAGHNPMLEQPEEFVKALRNVHNRL